MSWFRQKGKYWYFVENIGGKEEQHYIGDDERVKEKLLGAAKREQGKQKEIVFIRPPGGAYYRAQKWAKQLPKKKQSSVVQKRIRS